MLKTDLSGRIAVINGSGGALDFALLKALTDNGAQVALCCKSVDRPATEVLETYGDKVAVFDLDLLSFESIPATVNQIIDKFGKIDILVNNPLGAFSKYDRVPLHEMHLNDFIQATDEWLKGLMRFSKFCAKCMAMRKQGVIVNFLSVRGMTAVADQSIAVAVSAGLHGLSKMWGVEMRDYQIRANGIAVGVLSDEPELDCGNVIRFSHGNIRRPCTAEEAADTAVFLVSDAASYITGTIVTVDGGISAGYARSF